MTVKWKGSKHLSYQKGNHRRLYSNSKATNSFRWDGEHRQTAVPTIPFSFLWKILASVIIFLMILGVFQSNSAQNMQLQQAIRTWFTVDTDLTPVTKMLNGLGWNTTVFDRSNYEVVKVNATVAQIHEEMAVPVSGKVIRGFGWDQTKAISQFHSGITISTNLGEQIRAAYDGTVIQIEQQAEGYQITLAHSNGLVTIYGDCSNVLVKQDQIIKKGDIIGIAGTASEQQGRLYFEIKHLGEPIDPLGLLEKKEV